MFFIAPLHPAGAETPYRPPPFHWNVAVIERLLGRMPAWLLRWMADVPWDLWKYGWRMIVASLALLAASGYALFEDMLVGAAGLMLAALICLIIAAALFALSLNFRLGMLMDAVTSIAERRRRRAK